MRPVDEVLWSFANQRPAGQRFQLRTLEGLPPGPDVDQVLRLVREVERGALRAWSLPVEGRLSARVLGDRLARAEGGRPGPEDATRPAPPSLGERLRPLVGPLANALARVPEAAPALVGVLGRIPGHEAIGAVREQVVHGALRAEVLAALCSQGGPVAGAAARQLLQGSLPDEAGAGVLVGLRDLPGPATLLLMRDLARGPASLGPALAWALEGHAGGEAEELLDELLGSEDSWSALHALVTLIRRRTEGAAPRIEAAYRGTRSALARVVCLQEGSRARAPVAATLAREALEDPDDFVRAAALEALLELRVPAAQLAVRAFENLEHPNPRLARFAVLACGRVDPPRAMRRIEALLASGSADEVLQGVQCLAELTAPAATRILAAIAVQVPDGPLGMQAVRALGLRTRREPGVVPHLTQLLADRNPARRQVAAWFLSDAHPQARGEAADELARALRFEEDEPTAVVLATALGMLGDDASPRLPVLAARLEGGGAVAEAAGLALALHHPGTQEAAALSTAASPALRALGSLAAWVAGEERFDGLTEALEEAEGAALLRVAGTARLVAEVARQAPHRQRLAGLASLLGADGPAPRGAAPADPESEELASLTESTILRAEQAAAALAGLRERLAAGAEGALRRASALQAEAADPEGHPARRRLVASILGVLALGGLGWALAGGGSPEGGPALVRPPPRLVSDDEWSQARFARDRERLLELAGRLPTDPTTHESFPVRWNALRAWLVHPRAAGDPAPAVSFDQLMELRRRFAREDPLAEPRLDEWLTVEAERISPPDPPGEPPDTPTR